MSDNIPLLDIGQDLSNLRDEFMDGSIVCANLNAEIEDMNLFGKDKINQEYINFNVNELTAFGEKMDYYIKELQDLKTKITDAVNQTKNYVDNFKNHLY